MIYCEQCGTANDIAEKACSRCGAPLVTETAPHESLAAAGAQRPSSAASLQQRFESADMGMTADLKLPEWLKSAAASTPHDPSAHAGDGGQLPPAGFVVQPPSEPQQVAANHEPAPPTPPDPEVESPPARAAGAPPIPEWMRAGVPPQAQASANADLSDTSSFISENDLPEWIRQIADADAVKRAEEQRQAAETAQAAALEAAGGKRAPLPGETTNAGHASNPWLSRRENATAPGAWSGAAAREAIDDAPPVVETVVIPSESAATPPTTATEAATNDGKPRGRFGKGAKPAGERSRLSVPNPPSPESTSQRIPPMRLVLIGAIVLLLVVAVAVMAL